MKCAPVISLGIGLLVIACSSSPSSNGKTGDVAGGQSGTDSSGAYSCFLEDDASVESVDIDLNETWPSGGLFGCSGQSAVATHQPAITYDCKELGHLTVTVGSASSAQRLTGTTYSDTGDPGPGRSCYVLRIVAPIQITSEDGSISFDSAAYTARYTCEDAEVEGTLLDAQGAHLSFVARRGELLVYSDGSRSIDCQAVEP
jgi:hypothetical protein